jgi:hypothetical protein
MSRRPALPAALRGWNWRAIAGLMLAAVLYGLLASWAVHLAGAGFGR